MILPPSAGVIGWPVAQSKSPLIHRFWLGKLGIDGDYGRFPVAPEHLGAAIRALPALGLRGVNVTVPHKVTVMAHLDAIDPAAAAIGAVNTVVIGSGGRLTGYNTDIDGVLEPLADVALAGAAVVVLGAGGAARAVFAALRARRVEHVSVVVRDVVRGRVALDAAGVAGDVLPWGTALPPAALLVNATSLGMTGQPPLGVDLSGMPVETVVYDLVYAPLETPLLAAARARGMPVIDGLAMLIGQAASAFAHFYGAAAPRQHDAELRGLLMGKSL